MEELVVDASKNKKLRATTDPTEAMLNTDVSFISVGTPSQRNGELDLRGIKHVCQEIGSALKKKQGFHGIVIRSTVLPGTTENVAVPALEAASGKKAGTDFAVFFVPEFLREGTAVADFFEPPFTVLGGTHPQLMARLRELFGWAPCPIFEVPTKTAEMVKYVCNSFHALKVSFANEVGAICKELNVDAESVTKVYTSDTTLNISTAYLKPGFAFGGSCLPKDLRAITYRAKELDLKLPLFESIMPSNDEHLERAIESILRTEKRKVGVLGLSFKSGTDDLRESPLVRLVKRLLGEGCEIKIWDPEVALGRLIGSNRQFINDYIPHIGSLLCEDAADVVKGADVVVVGIKTDKDKLAGWLRPDHYVIDLVHLDSTRRYHGTAKYEGICW
jgi:GDP-mannose 6-dehydrogenase